MASLGAIACLFVGLMLGARILRRLGDSSSSVTPGTARPVGGRRAMR